MQEQLTPEQIQYLKDRGFCWAIERPGDSEFPYVVLGRSGACITSEYGYHTSYCTETSDFSHAHPANTELEELVDNIEMLVADEMRMDGKAFKTTPGMPIKIFVVDLAWQEVAQRLVERYA